MQLCKREDRFLRRAGRAGVIRGYGNGMIGPNDPITREQLAVLLWRYAGSPAAAQKELSFSDVGESDAWAMDALLWANETGVMNGDEAGCLNPSGNASRAHIAQMMMNYLKNN